MHGDIRDDWKIQGMESSIRDLERSAYEVPALQRDMDRLEHTYREMRSEIDGLRAGLLDLQERFADQCSH